MGERWLNGKTWTWFDGDDGIEGVRHREMLSCSRKRQKRTNEEKKHNNYKQFWFSFKDKTSAELFSCLFLGGKSFCSIEKMCN